MGCTCIPPPPVFDIPAPPDPSLVWHLLSDEPVEHLKQVIFVYKQATKVV